MKKKISPINNKEINLFDALSADEILESDIMSYIAMKIIDKRLSMGMSQKEFATHLGVSQSMVAKWESCEYNFSIKSLLKLASALEVKLGIELQ